ncbi:MAG TPA: hypothetical protein V6D29_17140 [Leptolyngbyaceae cyanobacterium]
MDVFSRWGDGLRPLVWRPFSNFFQAYPMIGWLVVHPLWGLLLVGLGLLLLAGLWSAIARLTENFWLVLVRLPFRIMATLFSAVASLWSRQPQPSEAAKIHSMSGSDHPNRLTEIVARLEVLQEEQVALMQEMRTLLAAQSAESGSMVMNLPQKET